MAYNLMHKNVFGVGIVLLLIVLLSQAKTFHFLIDTALGRFFLILFIVTASYIHNILGVIMVLFIIINVNKNTVEYDNWPIWNQLNPWNSFDNYNYVEGFEDASGSTTDASNNTAKPSSAKKTDTPSTSNTVKPSTDASSNTVKPSSEKTTDAANTSMLNALLSKMAESTSTPSTKESFEGFNIIDTEGSILKGKPSNELPVYSYSRKQNDDIEPANGSVLSGKNFALYK